MLSKLVRAVFQAGISASFLLMPCAAFAAVTTYANDLATFNAAAGATSVFNFDGIAPGTNISGIPLSGMTFTSPDSNSLPVVRGLDTFTLPGDFSGTPDPTTNKLFPTSGQNVLSPGGTYLAPGSAVAERDSLEIAFTNSLHAFGIDVLYQSLDCCSYVSYVLYNSANVVIGNGGVPGLGGGGGDPGGAVFMGFISDDVSTNIARIVFTETDGDASFPDANVGFDTIRIAAPVPEPGTYAMLLAGFGLLGFMVRRRRRDVV